MKSNFLPLFKFPTSIALIDDDALFVKSTAEYLLTLSDKFKICILELLLVLVVVLYMCVLLYIKSI